MNNINDYIQSMNLDWNKADEYLKKYLKELDAGNYQESDKLYKKALKYRKLAENSYIKAMEIFKLEFRGYSDEEKIQEAEELFGHNYDKNDFIEPKKDDNSAYLRQYSINEHNR